LQLETRAERERSERKFRNLVEAAACMIVIMREDFRVVYFSPYAERLTGHAAVDVLNKPFGELFAVASEQEEGMHEGWLGADTQLPMTNVDMPIRCRDGSVRWLAWNALRLDEFEGSTAVLAVGHDITEKRRSAERLLQAERLAAIGQTITGLAHESRNALQRINSCTEMLEFEVEGNSEAIQLIRRSQQAQDDLARLFDEVRNFAAPISLELTPGPVDKIWREAWGLMHSECRGRDASLREQIEADDLVVLADRFRLVQVFRNLFENSLAACSDPVRIEIVCRSLPAAAIDLSELPRGPVATATRNGRRERSGPEPATPSDWIEIRVRDNGPGLDPRARREVFEPFFTTKTKGTGLGMAIAHRVLAAHGGSITVGDPGRRGAEFVLRLPRACDEPVSTNRRRG
jgi:PAS domain S-box-containing protein